MVAPQASASSRKADCQFRVTMSWAQFRNNAPYRCAPARSAPSSTALKRFVPSRWALDRSASQNCVPLRSAPRSSARERSNLLKSSPRRTARDKSGASSYFARHAFQAAAPRPSIATWSSFGIFRPYHTFGQLYPAAAAHPVELALRQAFGARQIGIGQVRAVKRCQTQIRSTQIGAAQRGPDEERTAQPGFAKVGLVELGIAKSGPAQVRPAQFGPRQHGGVEQNPTHIGITKAGATQHRLRHQRELKIRLGETGVLKARRNEVCPA